ncbi:hypothetical protein HanIR_Chr08g0350531 [Helianthus annuus]|nr:hypothetical protein HanIR_Chr08g0350531 [Helianthus annuus]
MIGSNGDDRTRPHAFPTHPLLPRPTPHSYTTRHRWSRFDYEVLVNLKTLDKYNTNNTTMLCKCNHKAYKCRRSKRSLKPHPSTISFLYTRNATTKHED